MSEQEYIAEANEVNVCQCCGEPLDKIEQEWRHKPPTVLVTCWNKDCVANGFTVSAEGYAERNMREYVQGLK